MFHHRQRWLLLAVIVLIVLSTGAAILGLVQTCRPLDIALKITGCVRTLTFQGLTLEYAALSPDNTLLVVAAGHRGSRSNYEMRAVRLPDALPVWTTPLTESTQLLRFTPDGQKLASTGFLQKDVDIRSATTGQIVATLPTTYGYLSFSLDSQQIVVGGERYSMKDYQPLGKVTFPSAVTTGVTLSGLGVTQAFSPQGDIEAKIEWHNALGEEDLDSMRIEVYRVADTHLLHVFRQGLLGSTARLVFSPNGTFLVSYYSDDERGAGSSILIWRMSDGQLLRHIRTREWVNAITWSEDSQWLLAVYSHQSSVEMYDVAYLDGDAK